MFGACVPLPKQQLVLDNFLLTSCVPAPGGPIKIIRMASPVPEAAGCFPASRAATRASNRSIVDWRSAIVGAMTVDEASRKFRSRADNDNDTRRNNGSDLREVSVPTVRRLSFEIASSCKLSEALDATWQAWQSPAAALLQVKLSASARTDTLAECHDTVRQFASDILRLRDVAELHFVVDISSSSSDLYRHTPCSHSEMSINSLKSFGLTCAPERVSTNAVNYRTRCKLGLSQDADMLARLERHSSRDWKQWLIATIQGSQSELAVGGIALSCADLRCSFIVTNRAGAKTGQGRRTLG